MSSKKRVGIALCGLGRMGFIHAKNIIQSLRGEFLYLVEEDMVKAKEFIDKNYLSDTTKIVHFNDFKKVLDSDSRIDAVIVATPTHTHGNLVKLAIEAGKNVLCEKPLSVDLEEAMDCYRMAKEKNLALLCAFNRRFDPQIRSLIENKEKIGKLLTIRVCSRDAPRPSINYLKISGGIFHDCLVHDMDLGRWIVGENPETIYVAGHCHDPEIAMLDDCDTVLTTVKFPSGVLMNIESQRECVYGYDQTIEIYGTKGNMISSNPRKSAITVNGGQNSEDIYGSFDGRYADAYRQEVEHFYDLIQGLVSTPFVTNVDTLQATLLSQAAEDSFKESRIIDYKSHAKQLLVRSNLKNYV